VLQSLDLQLDHDSEYHEIQAEGMLTLKVFAL